MKINSKEDVNVSKREAVFCPGETQREQKEREPEGGKKEFISSKTDGSSTSIHKDSSSSLNSPHTILKDSNNTPSPNTKINNPSQKKNPYIPTNPFRSSFHRKLTNPYDDDCAIQEINSQRNSNDRSDEKESLKNEVIIRNFKPELKNPISLHKLITEKAPNIK